MTIHANKTFYFSCTIPLSAAARQALDLDILLKDLGSQSYPQIVGYRRIAAALNRSAGPRQNRFPPLPYCFTELCCKSGGI